MSAPIAHQTLHKLARRFALEPVAAVWVAAPREKARRWPAFCFFQDIEPLGTLRSKLVLRTFGLMDMREYWEIIAKNLSKAGWAWGFVRAINSDGQTIFVAEAHRRDGKRFIVRAHKLLTAFVELESTIRAGIPEKNVASCDRLRNFA